MDDYIQMTWEEVKTLMEKSFTGDKEKICHQFDRVCQLVLKRAVMNYHKHLKYRREHETSLDELNETEFEKLCKFDEYSLDAVHYKVLGYDIAVRNDLIAEALNTLSEQKRNVILMSYYLEMSDAEIADQMHLVRSTIYWHRKRSLVLLRGILESDTNEKRTQKRKK